MTEVHLNQHCFFYEHIPYKHGLADYIPQSLREDALRPFRDTIQPFHKDAFREDACRPFRDTFHKDACRPFRDTFHKDAFREDACRPFHKETFHKDAFREDTSLWKHGLQPNIFYMRGGNPLEEDKIDQYKKHKKNQPKDYEKLWSILIGKEEKVTAPDAAYILNLSRLAFDKVIVVADAEYILKLSGSTFVKVTEAANATTNAVTTNAVTTKAVAAAGAAAEAATTEVLTPAQDKQDIYTTIDTLELNNLEKEKLKKFVADIKGINIPAEYSSETKTNNIVAQTDDSGIAAAYLNLKPLLENLKPGYTATGPPQVARVAQRVAVQKLKEKLRENGISKGFIDRLMKNLKELPEGDALMEFVKNNLTFLKIKADKNNEIEQKIVKYLTDYHETLIATNKVFNAVEKKTLLATNKDFNAVEKKTLLDNLFSNGFLNELTKIIGLNRPRRQDYFKKMTSIIEAFILDPEKQIQETQQNPALKEYYDNVIKIFNKKKSLTANNKNFLHGVLNKIRPVTLKKTPRPRRKKVQPPAPPTVQPPSPVHGSKTLGTSTVPPAPPGPPGSRI